MRLRLFFILVGALLVAATFTFPLWQPYVQPGTVTTQGEDIFPGLPRRLQASFAVLPPDQQRAYYDLAAINRDVAVRMITAALQPGAPAPEADAELPALNSPELAGRGAFTQIDPIRFAQGTALIYIGADDRKVLRFENFSVANNADLRVMLSAAAQPATAAEMRVGGLEFDAGPLKGTFGSQNYELPVELTLSDYASVVLYSPGIDLIYSVAPLTLFS
ncbi:MAG: DM13 domain-containing protein [bacterium]|nr:DM13 domain-containing protein [bacterium]